MKLKYRHLFSPIQIRGITFKNRILSAPIGAWVFSPSNYIFDYAISMYEEKVLGGAAAVTVGHTEILQEECEPFGLYFDLFRTEGAAALAEFAEAIKQHGSHVSVQLNHAGHYGMTDSQQFSGVVSIQALTEEKIMTIIGRYAAAAKKLRTAGFDMCMIHGAHGWLPMQFLTHTMNRRTDRFGGSLENRMRFPIMLIDAVREAVGQDMLIEYRISAYDPDTDPELFEETVTFVNAIEKKVDLINVSSGNMHTSDGVRHAFPTYLEPRGTNIRSAAALKARVNIPIAVTGNITEPDTADRIIAEGAADFVAIGRGLIADPEWPRKALRSQEEDIRPCIGCYNCLDIMHHNHFFGCDVNPRSGREHRVRQITPARVPRKVTVVGGGPAGMQAAIVAAERGHKVVLYEKSNVLGGLLRITDADPLKYRLKAYKDYLVRQVEKHGIDVRLNTEAAAELVEAGAPDAIIVASGSTPIIPHIPGVDRSNVMTAVEAHQRGAELGERVTVIGGNLSGCETALYIQHLGKTVTVVEMTERILADANFALEPALRFRLDNGVRCITDAKCTAISDEGIYVTQALGNTELIPADSVVLAVGMRSTSETVHSLLDSAVEVIPVGDCIRPATVRQASRTAYFGALGI